MSGTDTALIVGAGKGPSASLARLCAAEGMRVALAARATSATVRCYLPIDEDFESMGGV